MGNNTNKTTVLAKEDLVKLRKELLGEEEINFHTFLKKRLIELNLQQKHLADMCNVSDKTISKWCSGRGIPDIMVIPILAEALDVSTHAITNSIFGIRDYYTVKDLTSIKSICFEINEKELSLLFGVYDKRAGGALSFRGEYGGSYLGDLSRENAEKVLTKLI